MYLYAKKLKSTVLIAKKQIVSMTTIIITIAIMLESMTNFMPTVIFIIVKVT